MKLKFSNSRGGLEMMMMLQRTKVEMVKTGCRGVVFIVETGGHYWRNMAYFLDNKDTPFHLSSNLLP